MKKLIKLLQTAIDKILHRNCDNDKCCGMCETASDTERSRTAYEKTNIKLYEEKTNEKT